MHETQETQLRSLGAEDSLGKEMATHSQYSCLENSMERGAWWATVHGVAKNWTQLSMHARTHMHTHTHTHTEYSSTGSLFQVQDVSVQFSSVAQLCLTLCNPMDCSTPGLPVHHQLLELDCTVLLYFSRCCPVRSKRFYFCVCLVLCVIYMKSVVNLLQYSTT